VWAGEDLEVGVAHDTSPLISDIDGHRQWGLEAARFLVVAGLLLDATGSPVAREVPRQSNAARRRAARSPSPTTETWAERRIVLTSTPSARSSSSGSEAGLQDLSGKRPIDADVRGHLKRQPHGPRGELRRWIWVEGYQARPWVAGKPLRISVQVH
jgi:hypothetical protein